MLICICGTEYMDMESHLVTICCLLAGSGAEALPGTVEERNEERKSGI